MTCEHCGCEDAHTTNECRDNLRADLQAAHGVARSAVEERDDAIARAAKSDTQFAELVVLRYLLSESAGVRYDVVARMAERIAQLEEEAVELRRSVPVHPSSLTDVFTMLEADLAAETATRTALRTQESQISGILANAGVAAGDLVRGVASLVGQLEEARLQRVDAQAAAEEYRQACARLRAQVAALQDDNRQLGGREDWVREQALREAAQRLREMAAERDELRGLLDAMSAARAPASADELDAARMDAAVARADLAAETATRTALRTQERQISGILADAGVAVGDLVQGVAALVGERDEARAWSRLWHREARRLWKETQALGALLQESQAWEDKVVDAVRAYGVARRTDSWGYEVDEAHDRLAKLADELAK